MIREDVAGRLSERFLVCFTMAIFCNVVLNPDVFRRAIIVVATYTLKVLQ